MANQLAGLSLTFALPSLRRFGVAASLTSLASLMVAGSALAEDFPVTERSTYVNACRRVSATTEVFNNSRLGPASTRVGTFNAGTTVTLTGVITSGRAQVYLPNADRSIQVLGWVDASRLGPCSGATAATTPVPSQSTAVCYRATTNLTVRSSPSTTAAVIAAFNTGDIAHATTNPPTEQTSTGDRRVWTQVRIYNSKTGWISRTGSNGLGSNVTQLPSSQCGS